MRRWLILATLATSLFGILTGVVAPKQDFNLPSYLESPVLAAEVVSCAKDIYAIYGAGFPSGLDRPGNNAQKEFADKLSRHVAVDFGFIASYGLLYGLSGFVLRRRGKLLGWIVIALVVAAVAGDVFENWGLWRTAHGVVSDEIARQTSFPSWVKWAALSSVWIGMSEMFWPPRLRNGWQLTQGSAAVLYAAAGCIGSWAVVRQVPDKIERALLLVAIATLVQLSLLLFDNEFERRIETRPARDSSRGESGDSDARTR